MSLVIAVASGRNGLVVSDGAKVVDDAAGRRISQTDYPKFRIIREDLLLTATGDCPMLDWYVYPLVDDLVRAHGAAHLPFAALAESLSYNLPNCHRECEARVRQNPRFDGISFDGTAMMLLGFDEKEDRARLVTWHPGSGYEMEEIFETATVPAVAATGVAAESPELTGMVLSVVEFMPAQLWEAALASAIVAMASRHHFIGERTYSHSF